MTNQTSLNRSSSAHLNPQLDEVNHINQSSDGENIENRVSKTWAVTEKDLLEITRFLENPDFEKARDKDIVLLIGTTGAGKSTTINYLFNCKFRSEEESLFGEEPTIEWIKPEAQTGTGTSTTKFPEIHEIDDLLLFDCPGFEDNRSALQQLKNALAIRRISDIAKKVSIALIIDDLALHKDARGVKLPLKETVAFAGEDIPKDSLLCIFSWRKPFQQNLTLSKREELLASIVEKKLNLSSYDDINNELKKNIKDNSTIFYLKDEDGVNPLKDRIKKLKGVEKNSFGLTIPSEAKVSLRELGDTLNKRVEAKIKDLENDFMAALKNLEEETDLSIVISTVKAEIESLENFDNLLNSASTTTKTALKEIDNIAKSLKFIGELTGSEINLADSLLLELKSAYSDKVSQLLQQRCIQDLNILLSSYEVQKLETPTTTTAEDLLLMTPQELSECVAEIQVSEQQEPQRENICEGLKLISLAHLANVQRLIINNIITPFDWDNDNNILKSNARNICLSKLMAEISRRTITDVILFIPNTLYFNEDLGKEKVGGKNVAILVEVIDTLGEDRTIDVQGNDGDGFANSPAAPKGSVGRSGSNATPSGSITILAKQCNGTLNLTSSGGAGGSGQKGGEGDVQTSLPAQLTEEGTEDVYTFDRAYQGDETSIDNFQYVREKTTKKILTKGLKGLSGLAGGNGGQGAKAGEIRSTIQPSTNIILLHEDGNQGVAGEGGDGGVGGAGLTESGKQDDNNLGDQGNRGSRGSIPTSKIEALKIDANALFSQYIRLIQSCPQIEKSKKEEMIKFFVSKHQEPDGFFELLACLEKEQLSYNFDISNNDQSVGVKETLSLYRLLEEDLRLKITESGDSSEVNESFKGYYKTLYYFVLEKVDFFESLITKGRYSMGHVVDLKLLNDSIANLLTQIASTNADKKEKAVIESFNQKVKVKISSGESQIKILKKTLNELIEQSQKNIKTIIEEIGELKKSAEKNKEILEKKEKDLAAAMSLDLLLGSFSAIFSILGTVSGTGAIVSQFTNRAQDLLNSKNETNEKINEIIDGTDSLHSMAKVLSNIPFNDPEVFEKHLNARLAALKNQQKTTDTVLYDSLEKRLLDLNKNRESTVSRDNIKAIEVELSALRDIDKKLSEKEKELTTQKLYSGMQSGLNIASSVMSGFGNLINIEKNYVNQIDAVKNAIALNQENITNLANVSQEISTFGGTLKQGLQGWVEAEFNEQNIFANLVSQYEKSKEMRALKRKLSETLSSLKLDKAILSTLEDFEAAIDTQLTIIEKIVQQEERLEMAQLIYGLNSQTRSSSESENKLLEWSKLTDLKLYFLTQLQAIGAYTYPYTPEIFKDSFEILFRNDMTFDTLTDEVQTLNASISDYLKDERTFIQDKDQYIYHMTRDKDTPFDQFGYEDPYKMLLLQTGEAVTFELRPKAGNIPMNQYCKMKTMKLHVEGVEKLDKLEASLTSDSVGIYLDNTNRPSEFFQKPFNISHSLGNDDGNQVYKKLEESKFASLSPYTNISVKISNPTIDQTKKFDVTGLSTKKIRDLAEIKWIEKDGETDYKIIKLFSEIIDSFELLDKGWKAKDLAVTKLKFFEKLKIFEITDREKFSLKFVGQSTYVKK